MTAPPPPRMALKRGNRLRPVNRVGGFGATGSISVFIAYPDRYEGQPAPDWAARAFTEDEPSARFHLNAVRTGEPAEIERGRSEMGFWGAWWAVEVRFKRRRNDDTRIAAPE